MTELSIVDMVQVGVLPRCFSLPCWDSPLSLVSTLFSSGWFTCLLIVASPPNISKLELFLRRLMSPRWNRKTREPQGS